MISAGTELRSVVLSYLRRQVSIYDILRQYYRVLNNAWKAEIRDPARLAIKMLCDILAGVDRAYSSEDTGVRKVTGIQKS